MCGISLLVNDIKECRGETKSSESVNRIDDCKERLFRRGPDAMGIVKEQVGSSVLHFLAATLHLRGEPTPQPLTDEKSIFLWNGEIFGGHIEVPDSQNDTSLLYSMLSKEEGPAAVMSQVHGPWSIIYWQKEKRRLWFGRDPMGRRSLLIRRDDTSFALSSVAFGPEATSMSELTKQSPRDGDEEDESSDDEQVSSLEGLGENGWTDLPPGLYRVDFCEDGAMSKIHHTILEERTIIPQVPDSDVDLHLLFTSILSEAVKRRVDSIFTCEYGPIAQPDAYFVSHHAQPSSISIRPTGAKLGILFSGGLDSSVLAILADQHFPKDEPIDLLNVSFGFTPDQSPDRITGLAAVEELRRLSPRVWNFIKINVHVDEISKTFAYINSLAFPSRTVMDSNISASFWFASRGVGILDNTGESVVSTARVLLMGLGADEQLAGYGRHQTTFRRGGLPAVEAELVLEVKRLWKRNLGRDDRVISDHGRECRHPFLDECFRAFTSQIPLHRKCDLSKPRGVGDKALLRAVGRELGLDRPTKAPKRAIQFGSRIAKQYTKTTGDVSIDHVQLKMEHVVNLPKQKKPYVRRPPKGTQHPLFSQYYGDAAEKVASVELKKEKPTAPDVEEVELDLDRFNQIHD
eukprot:TRINITY_DN4608_c0_g1_i1.p1 TRINITY_DN4608_c0_g1~~TRINITY_DN4608_c0_g1_i1.p1  ORF type:complete len:631 (-),score=88.13 TRINITY_DN4608_c0_g1_i1:255-2147(-)